MALALIKVKIMPDSPHANLKKIEEEATEEIKKFGGDVGKVEIEPIAFGLKAVNLIFVMNESLGNTDDLEEKLSKIDGVEGVEVTDLRRAIG